METAHAKASKLIALAVNSAASEHEARTAAFMAVQLIHKHNLLSFTPSKASPPKAQQPDWAKKPASPPKPAAPTPAKPKPAPWGHVTFMWAKWQETCGCCGKPIKVGDAIAYHKVRNTSWHAKCAGI
jgi:hypothetical protein